jgi:hypothetical protein
MSEVERRKVHCDRLGHKHDVLQEGLAKLSRTTGACKESKRKPDQLGRRV